MNLHLVPTHQCLLDDQLVLWHQASNTYSVVDQKFSSFLDFYFKSENRLAFVKHLQGSYNVTKVEAINLETQITELLEVANTVISTSDKTEIPYHLPDNGFVTTYKAYHQVFQIITDNAKLLQLIHPALAHLTIETTHTPKAVFYIREKKDFLYLFLNSKYYGCFPKVEYHLLQGRFVMLLLGVLHNQPDEHWMASFHASTIAKHGDAVMLTGASGKGKSTLTALLAFNNFEFVSDDVSGMLAADYYIYNYPAAISVKSGAFDTLNQVIPHFEDLPSKAKHQKGSVKYLPVNQSGANKYPCNKLVFVHYSQHNTAARLEKISTSKALATLIPDTWISPQPEYAKAFLEWLRTIKAYELHYHQNDEAIQIMEDLLKS